MVTPTREAPAMRPLSSSPSIAGPAAQSNANGRGLWPLLARGVWVALVIFMLVVVLGSLPVYTANLHVPCTPASCGYQQLTPEQIQIFKAGGVSLDDYATLNVAILLTTVLMSLVVSLLIIWRRAGDRMAVLVALMLVVAGTGTNASGVAGVHVTLNPWRVPNEMLLFINTMLLLTVLFLFPDGRLARRWMRWLVPLVLVVTAVPFITFRPIFDTPLIPSVSVSHLGWLTALGAFAIGAVVQIYRYWRVSTPAQRQQTKWVAVGFVVPIAIGVTGSAQMLIFPTFVARNWFFVFAGNVVGFTFAPFIAI